MSIRFGPLRLMAGLIAVSLLAACAQGTMPAPLEGNWLVEDIGGRGVIDRARSTIAFDDQGRVSGSGGCNQFNGPVAIQESSLTFGPLASTRRACTGALMDQEDRFFAALDAARSYRYDGSFLLLFNEPGDVLLRLTRLE